jgi:phospholipase/lecithinase/hemolysin
MMRIRIRASVLAICATTAIVEMPHVSAQQQVPYSGIVVFGTSLSDPGNAFALLGGTNTPADFDLNPFLVPSAPYARGGLHFSNGETWIEQFGRSLGLAGSVQAAYGSNHPIATNYAVGATRACDRPDNETEPNETSYDLPDQVSDFLTDVGGVAPADALYVIEMGGNDVRDGIVTALGVLQSGGSLQAAMLAALPALTCAQQSIAAAILTLHQAGAQKFLVWTSPNPGLTPAVRSLGSGAMQVAAAITTVFNTQLLGPTLVALDQTPGIDIAVLDAFTLLQNISANPANFGLTNTTTACITPNQAPYFCQTPDEYLFWDGIHPTHAGHAVVALEAARVLGQ